MFSRICISNYGNNFCKLKLLPLTYKSYSKKNFHFNEKKLNNNIIRAKSIVFELASCNNFYWFFTGTINQNHNRKDLKWLIRNTNQIIRDCRKKYGGEWYYLFIPEKHKDGSWHIHGLLSYDFMKDFYINENLYLSWSAYDKIRLCFSFKN